MTGEERITNMTQVNEWLALMRVHEGRVAKKEGRFLCSGIPADHLGRALDTLIESDHLALSKPDPMGVQTVCVTHLGQARFREITRADRHG